MSLEQTAGDPPLIQVSIAVLTYRRTDEISELLPLLLEQADQINNQHPRRYHVEVLVVDNDPCGGAANVVSQEAVGRVGYCNETQPGIAAARNRALDEAGDADLLVFIDDDERPTKSWLHHLLQTHHQLEPAAVSGPVVSYFSGGLDPWIVSGGFFDRRHRQGLSTGMAINAAATNNLLLDLDVVRPMGLRFDVSLGMSGGEDSLFTQTLTARGKTIVWCAEAVVTEQVLASRMNRRYVLLRCFSHGNSLSQVGIRLAANPAKRFRERVRLAWAGLLRILTGGAQSMFGVIVRSQRHNARGMRTLLRGAGMLSGALGVRFAEYARSK